MKITWKIIVTERAEITFHYRELIKTNSSTIIIKAVITFYHSLQNRKRTNQRQVTWLRQRRYRAPGLILNVKLKVRPFYKVVKVVGKWILKSPESRDVNGADVGTATGCFNESLSSACDLRSSLIRSWSFEFSLEHSSSFCSIRATEMIDS